MFNVTPIGSCRITAPLRHGQDAYGLRLNLARCYGYCHSPAEAVQMARFMTGDVRMQAAVWPMISRSHQFPVISRQAHAPSDLYVVEISSAKELTIGETSIQLNYLKLGFAAFFSDHCRSQAFWERAQDGDPGAIDAHLDRVWRATPEQRREADMLRQVRLGMVTRQSLRRDLAQLGRLLPRMLVVSHVDARKPDGALIPTRSNFIALLREEAERDGYPFFDPTELMGEFGQAAAMEDDSTSLAHFTAEFSRAVMDEWMERVIAPTTDAQVVAGRRGALDRLLRPQIEAAARHGRFASARARLAQLYQDAFGLDGVLTRLCELQADAQHRFIARADREPPGGTDDIVRHARDAADLGLFDLALEYALDAEAGFRDLPAYLLIRMGRQALEAGDIDNALEFALAGFARHPRQRRAAVLLFDLADRSEIDVLSELNPQQGADLLSMLDGARKLRLLDVCGAAPRSALQPSTSALEIADLAACLAEAGREKEAISLVADWRGLNDLDRIPDKGLQQLLAGWIESARRRSKPIDRLRALRALSQADPRHPEVRAAIRDARVDLVERVRACGRAGDLDGLEALAAEAELHPAPIPEIALWRARMQFDRGAFADALALAPVAEEFMSERIGVWVLLMRAALAIDDYPRAARFASEVVDLASAHNAALRSEAEAVLELQAARA